MSLPFMEEHADELVTITNELVTITNEDWMKISQDLEEHHALFYQCWQMGRPVFTDIIPTAAVRFNMEGDYIEFLFNPDFWRSQSHYERLFIIAHECLHVTLNHGRRTINKIQANANIVNHILDIVVNHTLVTNFGFDRSKIGGQANLCWVDTIFPDKPNLATNEAFEYYYNLLPVIPQDVFLLDDHRELPVEGNSGAADGAIDKLNKELTNEEKQSIREIIEKHQPKSGISSDDDSCGDEIGTGTGVGGGWTFAKVGYVEKKKKWETVVKEWSIKHLLDESENEQWSRVHRRFSLMSGELMLPSEMEEDTLEKDRLLVFFFLDTSGSCWKYRDRLFKAALSLPKEKFDIRLFCFDTKVQETTLESRKIYGGGGTNFGIIESHIQKMMSQELIKYPSAVFLITDGRGTPVSPQHPDKWHWFLIYDYKNYIPAKSKTYLLKDYE